MSRPPLLGEEGKIASKCPRVARSFFSFCLICGLAGCSAPAPKTVKVAPPPAPPHIEAHPEPIVAAIPSQLPEVDFNDPVQLAILEARTRFEKGQELYKDGSLKKAKDEFNAAIDVILDTSGQYQKDPRLQRELTDLVSKVNSMELLALREGDGLTDQSDQRAAIDDLEHVETFPTQIDPKLKKTAEDEVKEISHDLPIEINDRVLGFLDYYGNGRGRGAIEVGLERVGKYQPMIERILKEEGVPLDLIYLCQAESAFEPRALSRASAKGMWQFISSRGKEYGLRQTWWVDERSDPEKSTRAAARHLKDLYMMFGDWYLAMAAYNSGPLRVQRALEKTGADNFWTLAEKRALPKETINYIPNILALTIIGKNPDKYGFNVVSAPAIETERVSVDKATDLRVIAERIDIPVEELRGLNAHVLRWTTPPDDPDFQLILPRGYADRFNDEIASLPESKRILYKEHVVKKGDTLGLIARTYGTSTQQLVTANNLGKNPILRVGHTLIIPMSETTPPPPKSAATGTRTTTRTTRTTSTSPATGRANRYYTVRSGDTLTTIAGRFHTTVDKLKTWNHLSSTRLAVGKRLIIGTAANSAEPAN
jgi:membrane-bound lytic murein transglycosylase D